MHTSTERHGTSTTWRWLKLCICLVALTDTAYKPTWTTHRNAWRNAALRVLSTSFVLFPVTTTLSRPLYVISSNSPYVQSQHHSPREIQVCDDREHLRVVVWIKPPVLRCGHSESRFLGIPPCLYCAILCDVWYCDCAAHYPPFEYSMLLLSIRNGSPLDKLAALPLLSDCLLSNLGSLLVELACT